MVFLANPAVSKAPISDESRAAFGGPSSPLWCRQLMVDSSLTPIEPNWPVQHDGRGNTLANSPLSTTLQASNMIQAWQALYRPRASSTSSATQLLADDKSPLTGESLCLFKLGNGVDSQESVADVDLTANIIRFSMRTATRLFNSEGDTACVLEFSIKYKNSMVMPGTYMVRTWLQRKTKNHEAWLQSEMLDGNNIVVAEAQAVFLDGTATSKL
ncbi:hypothetical protein NQ176_g1894 [Zarea fungicola]|uniref:Uncharacterized protein n=1 Tax=Zarea fungicola TaxID=93591 RepID=A0ACC1NTI4_9HYPO|nr:hypothetical protein NQ176_g1894 [Lecanicillium fungicola]